MAKLCDKGKFYIKKLTKDAQIEEFVHCFYSDWN